MEINEISSLSEYISCISNTINENEKDELNRPKEFLYRGQSNELYELIPSLGRYKNGTADICFVERNMIEMTKFKMPEVFKDNLKPIELLSLLQHYGVPTRMLDITENSLVALYFACCSNYESDGEVFVFENIIDDIVDYPMVNAIADSYRFARGSAYPLDLFYQEVITQPYFLEQKLSNEICHKNPKEGGLWVEECCATPFFVRPSLMLKRQQIQRGRYILFNNMILKLDENNVGMFCSKIESMSKDDKSIIGRIRIPCEKKYELLKELKSVGIEKSILFSDSVDIVCNEIKKEFFG